MKKRMLAVLLAVCMVMTMVPTVLGADVGTTFAVDGINYKVTDSANKYVEVTTGTYSGDVTIPATVLYGAESTTYTVVGIGYEAFYGQTVSSLTLPANSEVFTYIAQNSFVYSKIKALTIPASVTTIGGNAFVSSTITSITFAENSSLKEIGAGAFAGCSDLTTLVLPEGLETIGSAVFAGCTSLASAKIPSTVIDLDKNAFSGMQSWGQYYTSGGENISFADGCIYQLQDGILYDSKKLLNVYELQENVVVPEGIEEIGRGAFNQNPGNSTLKSITLPSTLKTVGNNAFAGNKGLTSLTIPASVSSLGQQAFASCGFTTVTIEDGTALTAIGEYAFSNCKSLQSIIIPAGVTTIGQWAFNECTSLTAVTLPESLTTIQNQGFYKCSALAAIDLPDSLTTLGTAAFQGTGLKNVIIPDGVETIPKQLFTNASALESVTIPASVTLVGANFLANTSNVKITSYAEPSVFTGTNVLNKATTPTFIVPDEKVEAYQTTLQSAGISSESITGGAPTLVTGVTLDKETAGVAVGSTVTLTATVAPSDATNQDVTWASDNEEVATVENGVVTGVKAGTAIITVTTVDGGKTDTCTITVTDAETPPEKPVQKPVVFPGILGETPFTDVDTAADFYEAVQYVYASGLMMGTAPDEFAPEATLTRAMIWTILARMSGVDTETDANQPWWAKARTWAMDQGITDGTYPERAVTRLELVTMLWRFYNSPGGAAQLTGVGNVPAWGLEALRWAAQYGLIDVAGWKQPATRAETAVALYKA